MADRWSVINRTGVLIPGKAQPAYAAAERIYEQVIEPLLAEARREGAEQALREAAEVWGEGAWRDQWLVDAVPPTWAVVQSTERWLTARVDAARGAVSEPPGPVWNDYTPPQSLYPEGGAQ